MNSIVGRIKIEASLNIAEKRLPQDGRITKKIAGKGFDIRVSTIPTSRAYERIVMRLLNKSSVLLDLPDLGFSPRDYHLMDALIHKPDGIILVTGPTGSGKTTTLYACLNRINQPNINILTAEDPVEYDIDGIIQIPINEAIGLDFPRVLRAFLRQDPDRIMIGEMRDKETATIGIQAALTGHLVFSTLHTNDAASAITRLVDLGVPPYLISATVIGVLAQRLARTLCTACKTRDEATTRERLDALVRPWRMSGGVRPYKPVGCLVCRQTGYRGRVGLYELLVLGDEARRAVHPTHDMPALRRHAVRDGMRPLRLAGMMKVAEGQTTVDEVLRATPAWTEG